MTAKKFINDFIFKKRYIVTTHKVLDFPNNVELIHMGNISSNDYDCVNDPRLKNFIELRKGNSAWTLFLYKDHSIILGYSFLHTPNSTEWMDSLPTNIREARTSNSFVYKEYRGKGIYGNILRAQGYFACKKNRKIWSVIEAANISSLRASLKVGCIERRNYLIKFWKRNIISLLTDPFKWYFLIGKRRSRR